MQCKICAGDIHPREFDICEMCDDSIRADIMNEGWWTETELQLPPVGRDVLTATHGKALVIGHLMKNGEWSHTCLVTHWQRLPKFPKDDVAEEPVKDLEEMVDKRRVGRPPGRKERITLNMSQEHIGYLKSRDVSYSKTIARLIDKELNA